MKPSIPKGTRDFGPQEMARRNYIFNTIRQVYELYGFQQIETPAMETLQTLMGKYGEEGDKLLFKVLNSGDCLAKVTDEELQERNTLHLAAKMCEKGLRYDLTVPFARYVVMHREELQMPFKRYQVQPVWRADRPQKGRYREFYQFDGDVVGSDSLLNEVELMQIVDTVFTRFGVRVQIKINNRKILSGIAEVIGAADKIVDITVAIDKLDKIGIDNVNAELREDGLTEEQIEKLQPIILLEGTNDEKLNTIADVLKNSETGLKGVQELRYILNMLSGNGQSSMVNGQCSMVNIRPHVSVVMNLTKPTDEKPALLTLGEVETFLHEFGHSLHGMFANTRFESLSGTNVLWDFVELPPQFMENFAIAKDFLRTFAFHYQTGEPLPDELIRRIVKSRNFMVATACLRQVSFGLLDMAYYTQREAFTADIIPFEKKAWKKAILGEQLKDTCMTVQFSHIMAGGYAAGYYSYKWAEVLDADAFSVFKRRGIFDQKTAQSFRDNILSRGGTEHPMTLYKRFRGGEPTIDALLKRNGIKR